MAVTSVITRAYSTESVSTSVEYCNAAISGTYVTGGFINNLLSIVGTAGSSPRAGITVLDVAWRSPTGYPYASATVMTGRAAVTTTKIFSAPGIELANGTAVPDAVCPVVIVKRKI